MSVQFFICNKQFQLFLTCLHYFIFLSSFFFFLNLDHSFKQKLKNKRMFDGSNVVLLIVLIKKLSVLYKDRSSLLLLLLLLIFERKFIYHGSNSDKNKI